MAKRTQADAEIDNEPPLKHAEAPSVDGDNNGNDAPADVEEIWKSLAPMEFSKYEVSNKGSVRNISGRTIRSHPHPNGHLYIGLKNDHNQQRSRFVHALVAGVFLPPPIDPTYKWVIHRNKDPKDCCAENLVRANVHNINATRTANRQYSRYRPVDAVKNDIVVKTYRSAIEAAKDVGGRDSSIYYAISDGKSYRGFIWRHAVEPDLDGEEWRPIPGYPGTVSNLGRYKNANGCIREGSVSAAGYRIINFNNTGRASKGGHGPIFRPKKNKMIRSLTDISCFVQVRVLD